MRQALVADITRQLGVVVSRRVSVTLGLWGEPGIGKTHAASEILEHLACHHLSVHATMPLVHIESALPPPKALPDWVKSQLGRLRRCEPMESQAVAHVLAASLSALAPFVLHLEDIHEADAERLELIQLFAQAVARTRGVGLLVTSRVEPPTPFRNHQLEPITKTEIIPLLEQELKAPVPADGLEWIFGRTRGNPLFAVEFARYLIRGGFLWSDGQHWHWRAPLEDYLPVTVEALLEDFLEPALSSADLTVTLGALVMLGETAEHALWHQVSGLSVAAFDAARVALEKIGVLRAGRVAHPLYREVALRSLTPGARRDLARRALNALEGDPAGAIVFVEEADLPPQERRMRYERAADGAQSLGRTVQAGRWLAKAVEYADGPARARLAQRAANLLNRVDESEVLRLLQIAVTEAPDDTGLAIDLARQYARIGLTAEMNQVLERLPKDSTVQMAWLRSMITIPSVRRDFQGVLKFWDEHPEVHANPDPDIAYVVGFARMQLNDTAGAQAMFVPLLQTPTLTSRQRCNCLSTLGHVRRQSGDLEGAKTYFDEAIGEARKSEEPGTLASVLFSRYLAMERRGLVAESASIMDLRESAELYKRTGNSLKYAYMLSNLGSALGRMGAYQEAEAKLLEAHQILSPFEDSDLLVYCETDLSAFYLMWRPPHGLRLAQRYAQLALHRAREHGLSALEEALCVSAAVANELGFANRGFELASECLEVEGVDVVSRTRALTAKAAALEALGMKSEAIETLETARSSALGEHHQIDFELARLKNDLAAAQKTLDWFRTHERLGSMAALLRSYPDLGSSLTEPLEAATLQLTRLLVLGPVSLERNAQPVPTRAKKRLEFLAYLLETRIAGRSEASTLELVDVLYPSAPELEAKKSLKQLVYLNRTALGAESIVSTATGYALGAVSSDAEDFLNSGHTGLWRGAYLSGLSEGWHPGVRDALTLALRAEAEALLEVNPGETARLGALLIEMEPYDLAALQLTVSGLERAGKRSAARFAYTEGHQRLRDIGEVLPETLEELLELRVGQT